MPSKKPKPVQPWSMHPSLHNDVSRLLEEENLSFAFHGSDNARNSTKEYDTNIMGWFPCRNRVCTSNGWSSKRIAITIRMYAGDRYNARVYHQRCKGCNHLSQPVLDHSYAERVAYRLKKWCGVEMSLPFYSGQSKGPHHSDLCEGCKNGHCTERRPDMSTWF